MNNEELEFPAHLELERHGNVSFALPNGTIYTKSLRDEFQALLQQRQQDREVMRELVKVLKEVCEEWKAKRKEGKYFHQTEALDKADLLLAKVVI